MSDPAVTEHVLYLPKDAPALAAASACFPYAAIKNAHDASRLLKDGGRRVLVRITVEEIP